MLNIFGGGIKEITRKAKGKGKDPYGGISKAGLSPIDLDSEGRNNRFGSKGLPGGIVFSDRMGDQEMDEQDAQDPNVGLISQNR
jgi:hypothetical protein